MTQRKPPITWGLVHDNCERNVSGCLVWRGELNSSGYPRYYSVNNPTGTVRIWVARNIADITLATREKIWMTCENKLCLEPEHMRKNREVCQKGHEAMSRMPSGTWYCTICKMDSFRKSVYGIDTAERERRLAAQDDRCAICLVIIKGTRYHIDHCHETGRVRDLLCSNCNTMLGMAEDLPEILRAAADYIERHMLRSVP